MTYSIIDRLRFENQQTDKLKHQEKLRQEKYQIENKPTDMNHISSCDMSKEYEKVHKDKRSIVNDMYIFPDNNK
jgi:hypothetical protein